MGNKVVVGRIRLRQILGAFGFTTGTVKVLDKETGGTLHLGTKPAA